MKQEIPNISNEDTQRITAQFTNYIQKAIINAKIDYLRQKARLEAHEAPANPLPDKVDGPDDLLQTVLDPEEISADTLELIAAGEILFSALQNLPDVKKAVLFYLIVEERNTKETSNFLDKSIRRVQQIKKTTLDELRQILEREGKKDE